MLYQPPGVIPMRCCYFFLSSALSVVVITFALHAKGGQFDPGSAHFYYSWEYNKKNCLYNRICCDIYNFEYPNLSFIFSILFATTSIASN